MEDPRIDIKYVSFSCVTFLRNFSLQYIVTLMAKALLGKDPYTPRGRLQTGQQWKMCLSGKMLLRVAGQQRNIEDAG
jgi:hypothetical protein